MQRLILLTLMVLASSFAMAQEPAPKNGPPPLDLKALGLTDAQIEAVKADIKAFEQSNRDRDAEMQKVEDQKRKLASQDKLDRTAFEKALRAGAEVQVQRELARLDLKIKWVAAYGPEKARELERLFPPPQNQGPGGPGQPGPGQPAQGPPPSPRP